MRGLHIGNKVALRVEHTDTLQRRQNAVHLAQDLMNLFGRQADGEPRIGRITIKALHAGLDRRQELLRMGSGDQGQ